MEEVIWQSGRLRILRDEADELLLQVRIRFFNDRHWWDTVGCLGDICHGTKGSDFAIIKEALDEAEAYLERMKGGDADEDSEVDRARDNAN